MHVSQLTIYPVKATRGVSLQSSSVERRGLAGDRRWMIVDGNGRFVSQRELPILARLSAIPDAQGLTLSFDGESLTVAFPAADASRSDVTIWRDTLHLPEASEAAEWLSARMGRKIALFYHPDDTVRRVDPNWSTPADETNLGDAFPVLIATIAALAAVRREAGSPVEMERFRPNIVVDGAAPDEDDGWATIRLGDVLLDLVKPCARCVVTTVDQDTGVVTGDEPLATLRRIRMSGDARVAGVLFGWNAVPRRPGRIDLGDAVEVIARRPSWPIRLPGQALRRAAGTN